MRSTFGQTAKQIKSSNAAKKASNENNPLNANAAAKKPKKKKEKSSSRRSHPANPVDAKNGSSLHISERDFVRRMAVVHGLSKDHDVDRHLRAMADPWNAGLGVKSAVCYNPAPSFVSAVAKVTSTLDNFVVTNGQTTQIVLFPGHSKYLQFSGGVGGSSEPPASSMDPTSYHAMWQYIGGTTADKRRPIGPVEVETVSGGGAYANPVIGTTTAGLAVGTFTDISTGNTTNPIDIDVLLPYYSNGEQSHGEHLRQLLSSMGVKITNTTSGSARGGNIVTVQPDMTMLPSPGNQGKLKIYRSWRQHGTGEDGITVTWLPRFEDLAYWHTAPLDHVNAFALATTDKLNGGAIFIFLNNTSSSPQTYSIEIIQNFQIAGGNVQSVSTEDPVGSTTKPFVESAVSAARAVAGSATGIREIASKVSAAISTGKSIAAAVGFAV